MLRIYLQYFVDEALDVEISTEDGLISRFWAPVILIDLVFAKL